MKNKLCITTFVFGQGFESFIAIYIYSILKSYQAAYFPLIFTHRQLTKNTRKQLDLLRTLGKFEVVQGHLQNQKLNNQQGKSVRWLLDSPRFDDYQAIYIGDIDIFIVPEQPGLFEQHLRHCGSSGGAWGHVSARLNRSAGTQRSAIWTSWLASANTAVYQLTKLVACFSS